MDDTEDCPGPTQNQSTAISANQNSDNYLLPRTYSQQNAANKKTDNQLQIEILKRVKSDKLRSKDDSYSFHHIGYSVRINVKFEVLSLNITRFLYSSVIIVTRTQYGVQDGIVLHV